MRVGYITQVNLEHVGDCEEDCFSCHSAIEFEGPAAGDAGACFGEDLSDEAGKVARCTLSVSCWRRLCEGVGRRNERCESSVTEVAAEESRESRKSPEEEVAADELDESRCQWIGEFVDSGWQNSQIDSSSPRDTVKRGTY